MVIGICGKSGSGKSAVCAELEKLGVCIIDADIIGKEIMEGEVLRELEDKFPDCFENGMLVRKKLAARVFSDEAELQILNSVTHPHIKAEIQKRIDNNKNCKYIVVDAAVLIEAGMRDMFDCTVAVTAPDDVRIERIRIRDSLSLDEALNRISAQKPDSFYIENTDFYIINNGDRTPHSLALEFLERSKAFVNQNRHTY